MNSSPLETLIRSKTYRSVAPKITILCCLRQEDICRSQSIGANKLIQVWIAIELIRFRNSHLRIKQTSFYTVVMLEFPIRILNPLPHNCHCNITHSPLLSGKMGCQQSRITRYSELTDEDIKLIPLVFRDMNRKHMSPGVEYWFRTCYIQEGTIPLDVHVTYNIDDFTYREKQSISSMSVSQNTVIILLRRHEQPKMLIHFYLLLSVAIIRNWMESFWVYLTDMASMVVNVR